MIYEIREYRTVPGRMPALVRRFNEHTLELFARHGMELVFISRTEIGDNTNNELVYVLSFESVSDMLERWAAFLADPEWQQARADSERDGPIVAQVSRRVLNPAGFEASGGSRS